MGQGEEAEGHQQVKRQGQWRQWWCKDWTGHKIQVSCKGKQQATRKTCNDKEESKDGEDQGNK
jgi:hypothetical protein